MDFLLSPASLTTSTVIPLDVIDKHLKIASGEQLKVLLYFIRNTHLNLEAEDIAKYLKLPVSEVLDALSFWADTGILVKTVTAVVTPPAKEKVVVKAQSIKPTREDIAVLSSTDELVGFLLREAELKFRRSLRASEMQTLVWLYSDYGMDISLILMLVEYAISENKANIGFIELTALKWIESGVDSISAAERYIEEQSQRKTAWSIICRVFGLEHRSPSAKELEFSYRWVNEWGFKSDMLKEAYDRCVDAKGKISFSYINKILETWYKKGIKSPEEIEVKEKSTQKKNAKNNFSTYDKTLIDKLLNSDD